VTSVEDRLDAIESQLAIGRLPLQYAMATDARNVDAWVELFEPEVNCGRHGKGRNVLRELITRTLTKFYRSTHLICGHSVLLTGPNSAQGDVYCRAEHEVGDRWIVMPIHYQDTYVRVDGNWYFARRRERHWYSADVIDHPQAADFHAWTSSAMPTLPFHWPTWDQFWDNHPTPEITHAANPPSALCVTSA
jgi:hypothetical protein